MFWNKWSIAQSITFTGKIREENEKCNQRSGLSNVRYKKRNRPPSMASISKWLMKYYWMSGCYSNKLKLFAERKSSADNGPNIRTFFSPISFEFLIAQKIVLLTKSIDKHSTRWWIQCAIASIVNKNYTICSNGNERRRRKRKKKTSKDVYTLIRQLWLWLSRIGFIAITKKEKTHCAKIDSSRPQYILL